MTVIAAPYVPRILWFACGECDVSWIGRRTDVACWSCGRTGTAYPLPPYHIANPTTWNPGQEEE